jgi:hypothetical protein
MILFVILVALMAPGCSGVSVDAREGLFEGGALSWPMGPCASPSPGGLEEEPEGMGPSALQKQRKAREKALTEEQPSP